MTAIITVMDCKDELRYILSICLKTNSVDGILTQSIKELWGISANPLSYRFQLASRVQFPVTFESGDKMFLK